MADQSAVDREVQELRRDIVRTGTRDAAGEWSGKYGVLFDDPKVEQYYEALLGTLKAAKRAGVIDFKGQMLLKGAHDDVAIKLLQPLSDDESAALDALTAATDPEEPDLAEVARAVAAAEAYADHPVLAEAIGIARKGLARAAQ